MSKYFDHDLGLLDSKDLALAYLDKIKQIRKEQPDKLPNVEALMDLNYHGEFEDDALLNIDKIEPDDIYDEGPMSDYAQQLAHPWISEKDQSLDSQLLAEAAYHVATLDNLDPQAQKDLMVATAECLKPDDGLKKATIHDDLKTQFGFDDETILTAQDLADRVENEFMDYQDLMYQQFDQSGTELRTQNSTVGETEDTKKLRNDFLNNYRQGLSDELQAKLTDEFYEDHVNDVSREDVDLNDKSYGYMLGAMMSQQLLHELDSCENQWYRNHIEEYPDLSTEESDRLLNETVANDVRDDPKLRIMSDNDYQVMQHATLNCAYDHMKDALLHVSDVDLQTAANCDGINVTHVACAMQGDKIKQMTFADHNLIGGLISPEFRTPSYRMENAYYAKFDKDAYPEELDALVEGFATHDYDNILKSPYISEKDKNSVINEHQGEADFGKTFMNELRAHEAGLSLDDYIQSQIDEHREKLADQEVKVDFDTLMETASQKYDPTICHYDEFTDEEVANVVTNEWKMSGSPVFIDDDGHVSVEANDFMPYDGDMSDRTIELVNEATATEVAHVQGQLDSLSGDNYDAYKEEINDDYVSGYYKMLGCRESFNQSNPVIDATTLTRKMVDYLGNNPEVNQSRGNQDLTQSETKALFYHGVELGQNVQRKNQGISSSDMMEAYEDYAHQNRDTDILYEMTDTGLRGAQEADALGYGMLIGSEVEGQQVKSIAERNAYVTKAWQQFDSFNFDARNGLEFTDVMKRLNDVHELENSIPEFDKTDVDQIVPPRKSVSESRDKMAEKSIIHGINLNAKFEEPVDESIIEKQQTVAKDETKNQTKISKKQKANDGPEM